MFFFAVNSLSTRGPYPDRRYSTSSIFRHTTTERGPGERSRRNATRRSEGKGASGDAVSPFGRVDRREYTARRTPNSSQSLISVKIKRTEYRRPPPSTGGFGYLEIRARSDRPVTVRDRVGTTERPRANQSSRAPSGGAPYAR